MKAYQEKWVTIRKARLADISYIDHLRAKNSEAVGFIPRVRYEMEVDGRRGGGILICEDNTELVGFIYVTHNNYGVTHIQQIAIQEDARRMERGRVLIEAARRKTDWLLSCRCAEDLEATEFWKSLGFAFQDFVSPKSVYGRGKDKLTLPTRRKRTILRFQKVVSGLWLPEIAARRCSQEVMEL